ncbi:23S rRNA (pseudouridine(1915)-N(3))-methyltransferase RlmH [Candidatus Parcubacteria bacterium]|nr:23S rRNA (pseudouridine(1915)-N(3))-methyltransferase RlmH [Patescibacteria group bacterium]MBU4309546.1 23S rRNA (pseudouridine(1915)-N(3))-methyltransferase RlmH [Patescibacteria group bacterium]MBU4432172.1 23S rRNA (pseudouridine(1915)-N(3))-methyltransferase RlmH [Patescibacteria group bacterium]MBU4578066.1 23S rRNA (pseudouridine(1915)-N(3))-methyltransferase RlmH [Patescibacteria group bacterium]MCG2696426.1 23S rRNA (pseudouridine(1915)-N(3))-methyltransferase RlmH [Candidatus Parcu
MYSITILAVGKLKEKIYRDGVAEYLKRLKPYAKIKVVELAPEAFGETNREQAKEKENQRILDYLEKNKDKKIICLTEGGTEYSSMEFSKFLNKTNQEIIFIIGGALGFSSKTLSKMDVKLSLSKMTFLHEMARLILVEQIYRAQMIESGKSYHY